jgi:hypothetical protein
MVYRRILVACCAAALVVPVVVASPAVAQRTARHHHHHHQSGPVVVTSGLNNPRQLAITRHGHLLIAEAGKGGSAGPFTGPEGPAFVGFTGSISEVRHPWRAHNRAPHRIVTGLMSTAAADGSGATGSDGVAVGWHKSVYVQETYLPPAFLAGLDTSQDGKLLLADRHGNLSSVADISAFEQANDPDGHGFDSDPYAVIPYFGGHLVADAAANDVLWVSPHGHIFVFHVFPNVTTGACASQADPSPDFPGCNFVPNTLTTDRWGNVYVGGLSSLTPGEAQVVKLDPWGHVRKVWGHFTSVTGLAVSWNGTLYVSQLFGTEAAPPNPSIQGLLTTVSPWGTRTDMDVPFPTGLALCGRYLYVSAFSIAPDTGLGAPGTSGQVWRLVVR